MEEELSVDSGGDLERRKQRKARKKPATLADDDTGAHPGGLSPFRLAVCVMLGEVVGRRDLTEAVQRAALRFLTGLIQVGTRRALRNSTTRTSQRWRSSTRHSRRLRRDSRARAVSASSRAGS